MRVFAYCCESFAAATERAAGVRPVLSPPMAAEFMPPRALEGYDLLYFDLHGAPGEAFWRGDGGIVALRAEQIPRLATLARNDGGEESARNDGTRQGPVVFAASCYLGDDDSPMLDAFLQAGAWYVIGGTGENWGPRGGRLYGAPLLGLWLRRWMEVGFETLLALALAKQTVRVVSRGGMAVEDTLGFRAYERNRTDWEV